ncbi:hypothetical protein [Prevotella amnii]|uniref:hypothetical protein n=1 Tax=Prevotella amnii TaxID=419005 RepID=UPI001E3227F2|nr:hypothetical protein [Prevotella amnii]
MTGLVKRILAHRSGFYAHVSHAVTISGIGRYCEQYAIPAFLKPCGTDFLPNGGPFLGKTGEVTARCCAVIDTLAHARSG